MYALLGVYVWSPEFLADAPFLPGGKIVANSLGRGNQVLPTWDVDSNLNQDDTLHVNS